MSAQEKILDAMNIIADSQIKNLKLDKTVQGVISEIVNVTNGEYKVDYNGNIITAYAINTDDIYSVKEKVFVKIPENNMSNKKFIEGRANSNSLSDLQKTELSNVITKEGPTWDQIYPTLDLNNNDQKYCIEANAQINEEYYNYTIWDRDINTSKNIEISDEIFLTYAQNYDKIYVGADFQTTFIDSDLVGQGNYGLIFSFIARQQSESDENDFTEDKIVSYRLDINSFTGNPYNYTVFSPQETILDLQNDYLLKLKSIIFFQEKFSNYDKIRNPNICVKNLRMQFAKVEDLSNTLYYLKILTPNGTNLMNDNDQITLTANFLYKGQNILSENTCKCNWYIRDPSAVVGTEFFEKETGPGWRKLENNSTFGQYIITGQDVIYINKYMCKIIYNDNIILQETIDIKKYDSPYSLTLEQSMDGKNSILSIVDLNNTGYEFKGDWYYEYGDGTFTEVLNGKDLSSIVINQYLSYATVNFYCLIKDICVLEKTITTSNSDSELIIEYEGQDVFNYDSNGDMPIENCEKDQTIYPKLSWRDGFSSTYKIQWQIGGMIFNTTEKQNPAESMLQDIWVDNNGVLHFKIKQKYNQYYVNNTLTLKIITVDNKIFEYNKEIVFIKTGDQGTNGTKYVSAIRVVDENLDKISGFNPLTTSSFLRLRNFIYCDGDLINDDPNYEITYEWTSDGITSEHINNISVDGENISTSSYSNNVSQPSFNITSTGRNDTKTITLNNNVNYTKLIIKCKTTIITKSLNNKDSEKIVVYYNYPVPLLLNYTGLIENYNFNIDIPQYIKYDSNGINASYMGNTISLSVNNTDYTDSLTPNDSKVLTIKKLEKDDKIVYQLLPASTYDYNNNGNAYLTCNGNGFTLIYPIMMYLNTYGNEAINGWDGTNIAIYDAEGKNGGYILAPQIGAGSKNSQGQFTGVVMGKDTSQDKEGLYGYLDGVNTFGIKSDGLMYLGKTTETGRIEFNGNSGMIWGGGGGGKSTGMTIQLTNYIDENGKPISDEQDRNEIKAIQIGDDKFYVTYDGHMYSTYGDIGGWVVNEWGIFSPDTQMDESTGELEVGGEGNIMLWSKQPNEDEDKSAIIQAFQGEIGGWIIKPSGIFSPDTVFDEVTQMPPGDHSGDGVIMLVAKNESGKGYASIGGWIVKEHMITSQVENFDEFQNKPRINTRLDAKEGIITTEFFNVAYHRRDINDRIGVDVGRMGTIEGSIDESTVTYNLGIQTANDDQTSIILDATQGNNVAIRAQNQVDIDGKELLMNAERRLEIMSTQGKAVLGGYGIQINGIDSNSISNTNPLGNIKSQINISQNDKDIELRSGIKSDNTATAYITVNSDGSIYFSTPSPEYQHGIYCRFA